MWWYSITCTGVQARMRACAKHRILEVQGEPWQGRIIYQLQQGQGWKKQADSGEHVRSMACQSRSSMLLLAASEVAMASAEAAAWSKASSILPL